MGGDQNEKEGKRGSQLQISATVAMFASFFCSCPGFLLLVDVSRVVILTEANGSFDLAYGFGTDLRERDSKVGRGMGLRDEGIMVQQPWQN